MAVLTGEPRGPIWTPRQPYVGARRREEWLVDVLDMADQPVASLDGVEAGSLDESIHTEIRASASLTVAEPGRVDWHRIRLQLLYRFVDEAGQSHDHPLGVFLPTTPRTSHADDGSSADVDLYDKTTLLTQDLTSSTWTVDQGRTVVSAVSEVLASVDESRISAPDDGGGTIRSAMAWPPGTSKLRIVNDVLEAGGFFAIWVDGSGVWQLTPYVSPQNRGVQWTHRAGPEAVFLADVQHDADAWEVPNEVVVVGRAEQDSEGNDILPVPVGVARNENPADPLSIPSRGREITHTEEDQDAVSTAVLEQLAARRLLELSSVTSTYEIQHAWLPLDLNAAVRLQVPEADIDALTVLQSRSWSWSATEGPDLVSATLREVQA